MQQGPEEKTVLMDVPWPDEPPVLGPGQTFGSVTDTIADAVLTRPIGLGWLAGLAIGMGLLGILMAAVTYLFLVGVGIWGINIPVGLGLRHHQLRLVDRYRSRRHADLGHSAAVEANLAQFHQPLRRGHDAVCRGLRRHVPAAAHGPSLAGLLDVPLSQQHGSVAAVPQSAGVGRLRGFDLRHHLSGVLVCRPGSGFCDHARKGQPSADQEGLRNSGDWAGAVRPAIGSATRRCTFCWPALRRRWCSRCTPWSASISRSPSFPAGIPPSSRPTLLRARFIPALPWCWCWRFPSATTTTWKT